ncbi:hypothetical protein [Enterococcus hailinensis]|uniref:hypothetical protein n=1 Tax=Enterococcus hailinensis TaxID=3238988 RepID=UPI0038B3245C
MSELESKITINNISFSITKSDDFVLFDIVPANFRGSSVTITDTNDRRIRDLDYQDLSITFHGYEEVEAFQQALTMISTQLNQINGGTTK